MRTCAPQDQCMCTSRSILHRALLQCTSQRSILDDRTCGLGLGLGYGRSVGDAVHARLMRAATKSKLARPALSDFIPSTDSISPHACAPRGLPLGKSAASPLRTSLTAPLQSVPVAAALPHSDSHPARQRPEKHMASQCPASACSSRVPHRSRIGLRTMQKLQQSLSLCSRCKHFSTCPSCTQQL